MKLKALAGFLGLGLILGVLWLAGEQHVQNCQDAHKLECTVLPWSGRALQLSDYSPAERRNLCESYARADLIASSEVADCRAGIQH
jgi:hypothetical protein